MTTPNPFNQFLIWPFINLLVAFYKVFEIARIPGPFGWAIVALTFSIRTLLAPLTNKQMESARKMQALKPHIDKLQQKHKDDKKKLQEEQMKLYKEHGVNPAAGCLPFILSFPVLIALYRVFFNVLSNGNLQETVEHINQITYFSFLKIQSLDLWFFGFNLASKPSQWQQFGWWLLAIPVVTAVLQYFQMKSTPGMGAAPKPKEVKDKEKKDAPQDMAADMQKQMALFFPVMIGFAAYNFPVGLALYWNTFSLMTIWTNKKKQTKQTR